MDIAPVDGSIFFGAKPAPPKAGLDMKQFLRLLAVQMTNQNPLEPMNDRDFFAQMAQLGTVQGMEDLKRSSEISQAANLMGKVVTALRPMTESPTGQNEIIVGVVKRLTIRNGEQHLGLQEPNGGIVDVKMNAIREISAT